MRVIIKSCLNFNKTNYKIELFIIIKIWLTQEVKTSRILVIQESLIKK